MLPVLDDFNAQLVKSSRFPYAFNRQPNLNTDHLVDVLDELDLLAIKTIFQKKHQHRQISFYGPNHRRATYSRLHGSIMLSSVTADERIPPAKKGPLPRFLSSTSLPDFTLKPLPSALSSRTDTSVSYTHLTLPTKRIV